MATRRGLVGPGRFVSRYSESVGGLQAAIAAFKALPEASRELLADATEETCRAIWAKARRAVPIRGGKDLRGLSGYSGGALRNAIDFEVNRKTGIGVVGLIRATKWVSGGKGKPKKFAGSKVSVAGKGGTAAGGKVIMPSKYGHLVEFGHGGPHPARPHPFMIPAAESEKQPFFARCHRAGTALERQFSISGGPSGRTL